MPRSRVVWLVLRRLTAFAVVVLVTSCVTYFWTLDSRRAPLPVLLAGLPLNDRWEPPEQQAFTPRLLARFPLGSSEAALVQELWLEGFKPMTSLAASERRAAWATDIHQLNVCVSSAVVSWSADEGGHLTTISGVYGTSCL
jgi:hypothetical protein